MPLDFEHGSNMSRAALATLAVRARRRATAHLEGHRLTFLLVLEGRASEG